MKKLSFKRFVNNFMNYLNPRVYELYIEEYFDPMLWFHNIENELEEKNEDEYNELEPFVINLYMLSSNPDDIFVYDEPLVNPKKFLDEDKNSSCPICLENFKKYQIISITLCEHSFCSVCLDNWFNERLENRLSRICPLCRTIL